jgi:hypothetical protein
MKHISIFLSAIVMTVIWSGAGVAQEYRTLQMFCAPAPVLVEKIKEREQAPVAFGVVNKGQVGMNIWRDAKGERWTVTLINPTSKTMCVIADGTDFQNVIFHLKPQGPKT